MNKFNYVLGVDIGGSHITAGVVDLETKDTIIGTKVRKNIDSSGTAVSILEGWSTVIQQSLLHFPLVKHIGIAMPGPFDYEKGISLIKDQNKYNSLYQLNIKEMLADVIGLKGTDLMFINDAACFLKGELFSGAACGASRAIGLTLGTGLGSAKSINGEVEDANLWCSPFLDGIAEEYLSTKWFIKRYFTLTGKSVKDVRELTGIDSQAIKEQIFNEFGRNLALFLNSFIEQEQPEVIILGGNITNAYDLFSAELNKNLHHFSDSVRRTAIGEDACLIGAASSWQKTVINSILS